jgi:hypothetical protein
VNTDNTRAQSRGRLPRIVALIVLVSACAATQHAFADLADSVNTLRARGCSSAGGAPTKLKRTRALDAVAKEWSKGGRLQQALERTGYRAVNSSSMRVSGAANEQAILAILAEHYCRIVTNSAFTDIGIEQRGRDAWMVVATPLNLPSAKDANKIAREVLELVNEARSKPRKCGKTWHVTVISSITARMAARPRIAQRVPAIDGGTWPRTLPPARRMRRPSSMVGSRVPATA